METQSISILDDFDSSVSLAVEYLSNGEIIGFPTDTVYGIGCLINFPESMEQIFSIKERSKSKTLGLYFSDLTNIDKYCKTLNDDFYCLAEAFLPGAITIIVESKVLNKYYTSPDSTVAIRIPDNDFILNTLNRCKYPIAGTSANISGNISLSDPSDVLTELNSKIPILFSEGLLKHRIESTIVSMAKGNPLLLREGALKKNEIESVLGKKLQLSNLK